MSRYTQDLINILYTGIAHNFDDVDDFLHFMIQNMEYDFSTGLTFGIEGNSFVYYLDDISLFLAEISEDYINFLPGENFESIKEEPMLIKEALISFLIYFKNYDTMHNLDEISSSIKKDSKRKRKGLPLLKEKIDIEYPEYDLVDEDLEESESSSEDQPESEEESESDSDEWI